MKKRRMGQERQSWDEKHLFFSVFFPVLSPRCCPTHSQSLWPTGWPRNNLTFPAEDMVWLHFARPFLHHTHFPSFFFFSFSWKQKRQKSNAKIDQRGTRNQVSLFHLNRRGLLLPAFIVTSNENDKLMGQNKTPDPLSGISLNALNSILLSLALPMKRRARSNIWQPLTIFLIQLWTVDYKNKKKRKKEITVTYESFQSAA